MLSLLGLSVETSTATSIQDPTRTVVDWCSYGGLFATLDDSHTPYALQLLGLSAFSSLLGFLPLLCPGALTRSRLYCA